MWFDVDPRSSVAIYRQLVDGVKEAVARGILETGEKLPSVRELAAQVTINPNTIAKAYQELEREGIIETLRGRGTFVAAHKPQKNLEEKEKAIKSMLEKIMVEAYYLQLDEKTLLALMEKTVQNWYRNREGV
jgi:GntR family transcriptional regulator